ncbi:hypothetical protein FEM48_Zijuj06G0150200 [Ziziphus jujuba var. spinosa]|uniref:Pleiotropic drug resistance protein 1-like n=1 Tax=Ziziphus jujuba var. spinosa TaxID=714518 RepID=A0A978V9Z2_ZIZJJ|nr:hypothetical protein FEM48_Zijuj06G0150200 [Ziziphus jujuba var. spinosa]
MEVFSRSTGVEDDEEALKWAALERLPTGLRIRRGLLTEAEGQAREVDIRNLGLLERRSLIERLVKNAERDNENFLLKLKERIDRVGLDIPTIEVRFEHLDVEAEVYVGSRALPTILNFSFNIVEEILNYLHILQSRKTTLRILQDISGIIKPQRLTLLLGPPSSGKTTLLLALAGKLSKDLKFSGRVKYNGHGMEEFVPQRTSAYISQHDLHIGEMTAAALEGQEANVAVDYILKILGLEVCADTMVGDELVRGISGGEKKRVTTVYHSESCADL